MGIIYFRCFVTCIIWIRDRGLLSGRCLFCHKLLSSIGSLVLVGWGIVGGLKMLCILLLSALFTIVVCMWWGGFLEFR